MNLLTAAKAALEVMAKGMSANYWSDIHPAMDNLRAAIEEAEKQEPVAWKYSFDGYYELLMPEEVEQDNFREHPEMYEALYLHPAPSIPAVGASDSVRNLAENIMVDCGVAPTYDALREKIEARLWAYFDSLPPPKEKPWPRTT